MKKEKYIVGVTGAALLSTFMIGAYVYKTQQAEELAEKTKAESSPLVREHAQTLGPDSAKVHIVEFMDPGCETCRAFHPFVKGLLSQNADKIKLSIRYVPLHVGSDVMVKILEAARKQNKYWETLQVMFDTQPQWASHHRPEPEKIWQFLPATGLDLGTLRRDMADPAIAEILRQDMADARLLNVRKTPSFFVNNEPLKSFGREQLKALIDTAIATNY